MKWPSLTVLATLLLNPHTDTPRARSFCGSKILARAREAYMHSRRSSRPSGGRGSGVAAATCYVRQNRSRLPGVCVRVYAHTDGSHPPDDPSDHTFRTAHDATSSEQRARSININIICLLRCNSCNLAFMNTHHPDIPLYSDRVIIINIIIYLLCAHDNIPIARR